MRKHLIIGGASIIATIAAFSLSLPSTQKCLDVFNGVQKTTCNATTAKPSVTWRAWVKGQSTSVQFHFLDLVELMFSPQVTESTQKKTPPENKSHLF